jgi:hypothetical protein
MYKKLALYGAGGHASEVIAQLKSMNYKVDKLFVDEPYVKDGYHSIETFNPDDYLLMIPVSDSFAREKMVKITIKY